MTPRIVFLVAMGALVCAGACANTESPAPKDADTTYQSKADAVAKPAGASRGAGTPTTGGKNEHGLDIVRNPYTDKPDAIAEGKDLFVLKACSGCHGAGGGGGMCPPVINDTWVYGSDDTTLFNLVKLGSTGLQAKGYTRVGHENVVGDMPPFAGVVTDDELWKLLAYVRSRYAGDPSLRNW
ncbi:c-type cytochrome [Dokdonella soli]|uniref:C-type cytochrome n=1 Tax=Dokdonella soli TaxID=529810 RepID=A0ABP3TQX6_9GAMM